MLPLLDKPAIQYVVEEAVQSGIDDILIITGRGKRAIEDHFDRALELELLLKEKGDHANLKMVQDIADMAQIHYIRQKEQKGLGHAILQAKKHIGNEPFAVLLGDDIVFSKKPCTLQLIDQYTSKRSSIIAVERIPRERSVAYGVVKPGKAVADHLYPIEDLVEKPRPDEAPSELGILGRYVLTPEIFAAIEETTPGKNGEIQLTDALRLLRAKQSLYAYEFYGKRYDLGNKMDWLKTNVEVALMQDEYRDELRRFLGEMVRNDK
jgi:UTP--glucose-1-phosphate uridylyltransferase